MSVSASPSQSTRLRHIIAFIILFAAPSATNGLSIPRPRTARDVWVRPPQIIGSQLQQQSYITNRHSKLYHTVSNSDSTSLDEVTTDESSENLNITEKIESEIQQEQAVISQKIEQEKEELQVAVNEVKEAVVEVSQSAKNLGGAVVRKGPGITANFFKLWVSEAFR